MRKLKGKRIAVSMLVVAFGLAGSVTPTVLQASEVSTQDMITGEGYAFDPSSKTLTVTSNEGTTNWSSNANIDGETIETVKIEKGVTEILQKAFYNCVKLTNVTIPDSVKTIGDNAFDNCYTLTNVTIPDSVETIGGSAFGNCDALTNVTIPDSVKTIGDNAFAGCNSLTSVTIPDSVETIEAGTFGYCNALTNVTIPDSVKTIGVYAFTNCTSLTSVTMSSRVINIGDSAFTYIDNLTLTMTGATPSALGSGVFDSSTNLTINVPQGTGETYKTAEGWVDQASKISENGELPGYSGTQASTPTVKESTYNQVTLNAITVTGETVEYGKSSTDDASQCTWQDSPIFSSLNEKTTYYFFARVKANTSHKADTLSGKSVAVKTKEQLVESKLEEAKAIAVKTISNFVVTNDTETNELLVQLHADMQSVDGIKASWKTNPTIVKATETTPGSMQGTIVLTEKDKTVEIEVNKAIRSLNGEDSYNVVLGKDASWDKESTKDLVFTIDADHTKCKGIKIDDKEVLSGNYTITKGSTVVTLTNAYLKTLSVGTHEVTVVFEGKEVKISFSITDTTMKPDDTTKPDDITKPGDTTKPDDITLGGSTATTPSITENTTKLPSTNDSTSSSYLILTMLSGTILAVSLYRRKREVNN